MGTFFPQKLIVSKIIAYKIMKNYIVDLYVHTPMIKDAYYTGCRQIKGFCP